MIRYKLPYSRNKTTKSSRSLIQLSLVEGSSSTKILLVLDVYVVTLTLWPPIIINQTLSQMMTEMIVRHEPKLLTQNESWYQDRSDDHQCAIVHSHERWVGEKNMRKWNILLVIFSVWFHLSYRYHVQSQLHRWGNINKCKSNWYWIGLAKSRFLKLLQMAPKWREHL